MIITNVGISLFSVFTLIIVVDFFCTLFKFHRLESAAEACNVYEIIYEELPVYKASIFSYEAALTFLGVLTLGFLCTEFSFLREYALFVSSGSLFVSFVLIILGERHMRYIKVLYTVSVLKRCEERCRINTYY